MSKMRSTDIQEFVGHKMTDKKDLTGIEQLREAVNMFGNCAEAFNQRFPVEDLIRLYRAYKRSDWDIIPDQWTDIEISNALAGVGNGACGEGMCVCRSTK